METKDCMIKRDEIRELARTLKSENHWRTYRELRNNCMARIKRDRTEFFNRKYSELEQNKDIRGTYRLGGRKEAHLNNSLWMEMSSDHHRSWPTLKWNISTRI